MKLPSPLQVHHLLGTSIYSGIWKLSGLFLGRVGDFNSVSIMETWTTG